MFLHKKFFVKPLINLGGFIIYISEIISTFAANFIQMKYYQHKHNHCIFLKNKKYLFDIRFYSLKQYNDFFESRLYKILLWLKLITPNYNSPIGIYLWLSSSKDFDSKEIDRCHDQSLKRLATICSLHLFQKAKSFSPKIGIFIGILVTHEDNYYILMDEYGHRWYITCCSKLEFIKE